MADSWYPYYCKHGLNDSNLNDKQWLGHTENPLFSFHHYLNSQDLPLGPYTFPFQWQQPPLLWPPYCCLPIHSQASQLDSFLSPKSEHSTCIPFWIPPPTRSSTYRAFVQKSLHDLAPVYISDLRMNYNNSLLFYNTSFEAPFFTYFFSSCMYGFKNMNLVCDALII